MIWGSPYFRKHALECLSEAQVHIPHLTCTRFVYTLGWCQATTHTIFLDDSLQWQLVCRKKISSYLTNIIGMSRFQSSWKWKMHGNGEPQRLVVASLPAAVRIPERSYGPALVDGIAWQWRIATQTFTASSLSVSLLVSNREGKIRFQHVRIIWWFFYIGDLQSFIGEQ